MTPSQLEQRRIASERAAATRRALTHCKRGHEFTPENTIIRCDGHRQCRTCKQDWSWYNRRGFRMVA